MDTENVQGMLSLVKVGGLVSAVFIIVATYAIARVVTTTLGRVGERFGEHRLVLSQVSAFVRFGVWFIGIFVAILSALELSQEAILALSGTAGVALGFAFKDLATSVLAGITILVDKPFQVGDRVQVGDTYGDVRNIGLRSVQIATLDDNLVTVPNNTFLTSQVASGNAGELNMLVEMDFFVGIDQDIDRAARIIEEIVTSSRYCYLDKPWGLYAKQVDAAGHFAMRLRAHAYVNDPTLEMPFETDVTRNVMRAFEREGILPPARLVRRLEERDDSTLARAV